MKLTNAERDRILRATYLPDHHSREFVLTVVGNIVAERMAQAWDEGSEAAYYDPGVRGFVAVDDNPYGSNLGSPEVPDAIAGLPGMGDEGTVPLADEGPLTPPAGEAEVDHERGRLGAVGVGRPAANRNRSTKPELEGEVGIIHDPILDQHCSATLTASEADAMFRAWLDGDVSRGLEWLTPTVERIIADRVDGAIAALREGLADESLEATGVMERALDALTTPPGVRDE